MFIKCYFMLRFVHRVNNKLKENRGRKYSPTIYERYVLPYKSSDCWANRIYVEQVQSATLASGSYSLFGCFNKSLDEIRPLFYIGI